MLADSNLIIYAAKPENSFLRIWFEEQIPRISSVSLVEALGYHKLLPVELEFLETFFAIALLLPLGTPVLHQAVKLRQTRKMSLGDSLVAATALIHNLTLATRNTSDFTWIPGLSLFNPFDQTQPT